MSKLKEATVLISGGVDSAVVTHLLTRNEFKINPVYINYGQPQNKLEFECAIDFCNTLNLIPHKIDISVGYKNFNGEIPFRNAILAIVAAIGQSSKDTSLIALGIHSGVSYFDSTEAFISSINIILSGYSNGSIKVFSPIYNWDKYDIYSYCKKNDIDISKFHSCEFNVKGGCGKCSSCLDREIYENA